MNLIKTINSYILAISTIVCAMVIPVSVAAFSHVMTYNERVFVITDKSWVTNSYYDPSTDRIFRRGRPQGTRKMTAIEIQNEGLNGWYLR